VIVIALQRPMRMQRTLVSRLREFGAQLGNDFRIIRPCAKRLVV
jgi:hypothetical protein